MPTVNSQPRSHAVAARRSSGPHRPRPANPLRRRLQRPRKRRGAVIVEFAIVASILFTVVLGVVELSRLNMLRNTAEIAAYEGARRAMVPGATAAKATAVAQGWTDGIGAQDVSISISPTTLSDTTPKVTVTVMIPVSSNAWTASLFASHSAKLTQRCTLKRERVVKIVQ